MSQWHEFQQFGEPMSGSPALRSVGRRRGRRTGRVSQSGRSQGAPISVRSQLHSELLEARSMMAVGPQLVSVQPNSGVVLQDGGRYQVAPQELTFVFNENQEIDPSTLAGIRVTRAGFDGVFGGVTDVVVQPGYVGVNPDRPNEVIFRFAEMLPDDLYRIDIFSSDNAGAGQVALRNIAGEPFSPNACGVLLDRECKTFELDLGAQVIGIVPQPVTRQANGALRQNRDQIVVYFNNDDLNPQSVRNTSFYQLIFTKETATNTDDVIVNPTGVTYDAATDSATLTFSSATPWAAGTYRLRVGTDERIPVAPSNVAVDSDPGSSFATAKVLPAFSTTPSQSVSSAIDPIDYPLNYPGSDVEPGHREIETVQPHLLRDADSTSGVTEMAYVFRTVYGKDPNGRNLLNVITETQKQRAREVFEIYGATAGIQFYEIDERDLASIISTDPTKPNVISVVTGDIRALRPSAATGRGQHLGLAGLITETLVHPTRGPFEAQIPTAIMDNAELWDDSFGNTLDSGRVSWFHQAMHEVGTLLGLGQTDELPPQGIMNYDPELVFDADTTANALSPDNPYQIRAESIFPGDAATVHMQHLYRPESNDLDIYRFEIPETGVFSVEAIAERLTSSSMLDPVLTLYRENGSTREMIARNDDYFSEDAFIGLDEIEAGTYYLVVTASGNTQFDPTIEGTGLGGRSQGQYELRMHFDARANRQLVDATGVAFDGDGDGTPGGEYNFWFRVEDEAKTAFVDKAAAAGGDGSLARPYNNLRTALTSPRIASGGILRVVGNGGADGNVATLGDNLAYELGVNEGRNLSDGASLQVPKGVTLMVDGGAIFKLLNSTIQVGSSTVAIDRSSSALQVLGTPTNHVIFTSYDDQTIGLDTNPRQTTPDPGDWGGIIFQNDVDRNERRHEYEQQGAFVNVVNQADVRYGGGNVTIDSVQQVINPIHMIDARPTLTFNRISNSADAAMSANPDSFEETNYNAMDSLKVNYQATPFTPDYDRVGPDIRGNLLDANSINGLFVRISTPAGQRLERMTVAGRWDDVGIVHVLTENLLIDSTPGGPLRDRATGTLKARTDAQLSIDPGITVKLDGARIEVGVGGQILAEGLAGQEVVFTSLADSRFGGDTGTFQTITSTSGTQVPVAAPGDWGGLYIGHSATGSIDHAHIAFAGGLTRVEGSFAQFNAIEVHQGELRLTHSLLENNANGRGGQSEPMREGRGVNDEGAIFVHGAQPVIVGNRIRDTEGERGAAININLISLNSELVTDWGRSTGALDLASTVMDNQGPLVRDNRLEFNGVNGMVVRAKTLTRTGQVIFGNTLTTEGVWDDTDIVHVVFDEINIPDLHTFGGLRLESSATESLVVKFQGAAAGFTTTGRPLEIEDRVGGMLHVIGQPGHPVVMTSLADDTVGAGLDFAGRPQQDTDGGGRPVRTNLPGSFQIDMVFGPQIRTRPQIVRAAEMAARMWERLIQDPITVVLDFELQELGGGVLGGASAEQQTFPYNLVRQSLITDAEPHETIVNELPTFNELQYKLPNDPARPFTLTGDVNLTYANAKALGLGNQLNPIVSAFDPLKNRDADIVFDLNPYGRAADGSPLYFDYDPTDGITPGTVDFVGVVVHEIGHALGFVSEVDTIDIAMLDPAGQRDFPIAPLDLFRLEPGRGSEDFTNSPRALDPALQQVFYDGGTFDPFGLTLPRLRKGDIPLSSGANNGDGGQASHWKDDADPEITFNIGMMDPSVPAQGGIYISPADRTAFDLIGWDVVGGGIAGDWRGTILDQNSHDRNVGALIEYEDPSISGAGTNGTPETAQYLGIVGRGEGNSDDNLRLGFDIQASIGQPTDVDVYSFRGTAGTQVWLDIDRTSNKLDTVVELIAADGSVLARSDNSLAEGEGQAARFAAAGVRAYGLAGSTYMPYDFYSTNTMDAGLRLVLPGEAGASRLYHVRVRSSSGDLTQLDGGLTSGVYELQIRLGEVDEFPGVSVQYSDIRYANDGIRVRGLPSHSPLVGEIAEDDSINDSMALPQNGRNFIGSNFSDAQWIGNVLNMDRATISIAGEIDNASDVDWYLFQVSYDAIQRIDDPSIKSGSFMFDLDYADQLGRVDASIAIYEAEDFLSGLPFLDDTIGQHPEFKAGRLMFTSRNSADRDDLPGPLEGDDIDDLSRGSVGANDPMIGPVSLAEGFYLLQVSSALLGPKEHDQFTTRLSENPYIRIEPNNALTRIVDDHIALPITDPAHNTTETSTYAPPIVPQVLDDDSIVPFHLGDVAMYVATAGTLNTVDPFTGRRETVVGNLTNGSIFPVIGDIALRDNPLFDRSVAFDPTTGVIPRERQRQRLHAFANDLGLGAAPSDAAIGHYILIDDGTAAVTDLGDDGLLTFMEDPATPGAAIAANNGAGDGVQFDAIDFAPAAPDVNLGFAVGRRPGVSNILYRFRAEDGVIGDDAVNGPRADDDPTLIPGDADAEAPSGGTKHYEMGVLNPVATDGTDLGDIKGISFVGSRLFAVTDRGGLFEILNYNNNPNPDSPPSARLRYIATITTTGTDGTQQGVRFQGLSTGPQDVEGGAYRQMLFGISGTGDLFAFNLQGVLQPVFVDGKTSVSTGVRGAIGVEFATLDENLWHVTDRRAADAGKYQVGTGMSFYFGEQKAPPEDPPNTSRNYDFAGGAHGSLVTKEISLEGYSELDDPYLYFTYYLVSEEAAGVDTFRVFIADDSREDGRGAWHLLATNQQGELTLDNDPRDDISIPVQLLFNNTWQDVPELPAQPPQNNGPSTPGLTAPLYPFDPPDGVRDGIAPDAPIPNEPLNETRGVWRQARISLADFAGSASLRLRFDFSTAGSMDVGGATSTGGAELKAIAASLLRDGQSFRIDDKTFEFDLGFTLAPGSSATIKDGETFTVRDGAGAQATITLDRNGAGDGIRIGNNDTAADIAEKLAAAITEAGLAITPRLHDNRVQLDGAVSVVQSAGAGLVVEGSTGVAEGNVPVVIHADMTADEVAEAMVQPIADTFANGVADVIKQTSQVVRVIGHAVRDAGPLGVANALPGDALGNFRNNLGLQNNTAIDYVFPENTLNFTVPYEGVYVDDLIVGFESRGVHTIDFRPPAQIPVGDTGPLIDPFLDDSGTLVRQNPGNAILTGEYDVAIRRASEFTTEGIPFRTFDARDRFTQAATLVAPAGHTLVDGQTFTINDGLTSIVFEYDEVELSNGATAGNQVISFSASDPSYLIGERIRDAINTLALAGQFQMKAASSSRVATGFGGTTNRIDLFGTLGPESDGIDFITFNEKGSANVFRDQGQVIIANNSITHSATYGIVVEAGLRDLPCDTSDHLGPAQPATCLNDLNPVATYGFWDATDLKDGAQNTFGDYTPHGGSVRNLREVNQDELTTGVTIASNVVAFGGEGGVKFGGDPGGIVFTAPVIDDPGVYYEATDGVLFAITDFDGNIAYFEIQDDVANVRPGFIHVDWDPWRTQPAECLIVHGMPEACQGRYHNELFDTADSIMEAILKSNLNVNLFRGKGHEVYIEGAALIQLVEGTVPFALQNFTHRVPDAGIPFGRIVNNTIVGLGGLLPGNNQYNANDFSDVGIRVQDRALPTLLNNVVVNFQDGISVDNTARATVIGATTYQGNVNNTVNTNVGDFAMELSLTAPLFVDRERGNFYPVSTSRIIDSSVGSVEDRSELVSVRDPLGISPSPILAPEYDLLGQKRIDDPRVAPPDGVGENVFIDRGAIDRVDFVGPRAQLLVPVDNDGAGNDKNPAPDQVRLSNAVLSAFVIQLADLGNGATQTGTGIDDNRVTADSVIIRRNGTPLVLGVDYRFDYVPTTNQIVLSSQAGVWATGYSYEIELVNQGAFGIRDMAGNDLRTNQDVAPFRTVMTIELPPQLDFGDAPDTYQTTFNNNGARHVFVPTVYLGQGVSSELDSRHNSTATGDTLDDGVRFDGLLNPAASTPITVSASVPGFLSIWLDVNGDGDFSDTADLMLKDRELVAGANSLQLQIPANAKLGTTFARFRFGTASGTGPSGLALDGEVEDYRVTILSPSPWQNGPNPADVNGDGVVVPRDALAVINELNQRVFSAPVTGLLPNPPVAPNLPETRGYVDVDGDGYASPRDALLVINQLNAAAAAANAARAAVPAGVEEPMMTFSVATIDADPAIAPATSSSFIASAAVWSGVLDEDATVEEAEEADLWQTSVAPQPAAVAQAIRATEWIWDNDPRFACDFESMVDDLARDQEEQEAGDAWDW